MENRKIEIIVKMLKGGFTTDEIIKEFANNYGANFEDKKLIIATAKSGGYPANESIKGWVHTK